MHTLVAFGMQVTKVSFAQPTSQMLVEAGRHPSATEKNSGKIDENSYPDSSKTEISSHCLSLWSSVLGQCCINRHSAVARYGLNDDQKTNLVLLLGVPVEANS
eukprot:6184288-Pleurochrysis_carterae.AAC.2